MWVRPLAVCWENRLLPGAGDAQTDGAVDTAMGDRIRPTGAATPILDLVPPSRRTQCGGDATGSPSRAPERAADLRAAMMRRGPLTAAVGGPHEWEGGGDAGVGDPGDCGAACRALCAQRCFCAASRSRISVRSSTSVGSAGASASDFFMRSLNLFIGRTMQK